MRVNQAERFTIEHLIGNDWEPSCFVDGELETFATRAEAEPVLAELLIDLRSFDKKTNHAEQWRIAVCAS